MIREQLDYIEETLPAIAPEPVYIYGLTDPETGECRYIGKTVRPIERLAAHVATKMSNCHRARWMCGLRDRGLRPEMFILERVSGAWPWEESERFWISEARAAGWRLTNNTDGGTGIHGLPDETRELMAAAKRGHTKSAETRERMRLSRNGWSPTEATRQRMSEGQAKRRKVSPEQEAEILARLDTGASSAVVAKEFGLHKVTVRKIKKGTYRAARK
jgi:hypothetical protein